MQTVVQFGAGAIGRGFLAQLWCESGYEVVFVEANPALVAALNDTGSYPLWLVENTSEHCVKVGPVRALGLDQTEAIAAAVGTCAFAATAVGERNLATTGALLAAGLAQREAPLSVLVAENGAQAEALLGAALPRESVRLLSTSIGRMVPPPTARLIAEPYAVLPLEWDGHGAPPLPEGVQGVRYFPDLAPVRARKLFTHNGGHAALAYHGTRAGCTYLWEALEILTLRAELLGFWDETGRALSTTFGFDLAEQRAAEADLLARFANRPLGDTCERVGRDPVRKLRRDDRLLGAALLCEVAGVACPFVCRAIAAALRVAGLPPAALDIPPGSSLAAQVEAAYNSQ